MACADKASLGTKPVRRTRCDELGEVGLRVGRHQDDPVLGRGIRACSSRTRSNPLSPERWMSTSTTSGRSCSARATASAVVDATPTTSSPPRSSRDDRGVEELRTVVDDQDSESHEARIPDRGPPHIAGSRNPHLLRMGGVDCPLASMKRPDRAATVEVVSNTADTTTPQEASHHGPPSSKLAGAQIYRVPAGLGVAVALTLAPGMDAATAAGPAAPVLPRRPPPPYKTHITQADAAVAPAIQRVQAHQYSQARTSSGHRPEPHQQANAEAAALIGKPPTDPESDDLPGPPAVLAASGLDNRVVTRVVPLFNGMSTSAGAGRASFDARGHPEQSRPRS